MSKGYFKLLCEKIIGAVGIDELKSEEYIQELHDKISKTNINGKGSPGRCHSLICGEIKLAITLRMLAGSSYLDLMLQHDITHQHIYKIFHHVTKYWICNDKVTQINLYNALQKRLF